MKTFKSLEEAKDALAEATKALEGIYDGENAELTDEQAADVAKHAQTINAATVYKALHDGKRALAETESLVDWSSSQKAHGAAEQESELADPLGDLAQKAFELNKSGTSGTAGVFEKALTTVDAASAGVVLDPERSQGDPLGRTDELTLLDLIRWVPVDPTENSVVHYTQVSRTDSAAGIAEWDPALNAGAGGFPHVAESDYTWEKTTVELADIGVGMPMSRQASLTEVRAWVESLLRYDVRNKINNMILNGDGTNETFVGILNVDGLQYVEHIEGKNQFDMISAALTLNEGSDVASDGLAITPGDIHAMRTKREGSETVDPDGTPGSGDEYELGTGAYLAGGPASGTGAPSWGIPQTVTRALPDGVALLGQFSGSAVQGRFAAQAEAKIGDQYADFQGRNEAKYLTVYDRRRAVQVFKPRAFVLVELVPGAFTAAGITVPA